MKTSRKQKSPFHGHNGPTAKVSSSAPVFGGNWDIIDPLSQRQVMRNNRKPMQVRRAASTNYVPIMG